MSLSDLRELVERADTKLPCRAHYQLLVRDLKAMLPALEQELQAAQCHPAACRDEKIWRETIAAERAATLREAAAIVRPASKNHAQAILARIDPADESALDRERAEARLEEALWWEHLVGNVHPDHSEHVEPECMYCQRLAALRQAGQGV